VLADPEGTRVIVAPLKFNHPAVSVSKPLKYGPGGASAAAHGAATNVAATAKIVVMFRILIWKISVRNAPKSS
jgi:hypothetical protein